MLRPDVNESGVYFRARRATAKAIRFGLAAIKGVGEAAVEAILKARNEQRKIQDRWPNCASAWTAAR